MRNRYEPGTSDFYNLAIDINNVRERTVTISNTIDPREFDSFTSYIEPTDRILIAGAGLGMQLAYFGAVVGPDNIIGYETRRENVELIKRNVRVWGREVNIKWGALFNHTQGVILHQIEHDEPSALGSSSIIYKPTGFYTTDHIVPSFDAKEEVEENSITAICLDVEGAELEILQRIDLNKIRLITVEVHGTYVSLEDVKLLLSESGLTIVNQIDIQPNDLHPVNLHVITAKRDGDV